MTGGTPGHSRPDVSTTLLLKKALKTGYLCKLGLQVKNWKKRYCIMTHDCLYYFVGPEATKQQGEVILAEVSSVTRDDKAFPKKPYVFAVESSRRTFYFQAQDMPELEDWISILSLHVSE